ncbi:MAG: hypothetical protein JNL11_15385 [Bdellovibrionaceae bacterium]|nr:hypothetical protein [Pseudobdellovibrionaceae bacterium]
MLKELLFSILKRRKSNRKKATITCFIRSLNKQISDIANVDVFEISEQGLAFNIREQLFTIDERVEVTVINSASDKSVRTGTIKSQHIYYNDKAQSLKYAVYRFSVYLDQRLPNDFISNLEIDKNRNI